MGDGGQGAVESVTNHGWRVTFAGLGINLALGILYTWSVISKGIPKEWGWTEADKSWPYSICCLVFCLIMVPAGRMQDRISPRFVPTQRIPPSESSRRVWTLKPLCTPGL